MTPIMPPKYEVKKNFHLRNFGEIYYYPSKELQLGLKELIIFKENTNKNHIPNGSVWVYKDNQEYTPKILTSDVGCGITAATIEELEYTDKTIDDILNAIDSINVHIGQGNHFIDFTTGHPSLQNKNVATSMIFLHSDFNFDKTCPHSYASAKSFEQSATERRIDYLQKIIKELGIKGKIYKNWTHNSVNKEDDNLVYRKGCINVDETEGIGLLALNPFQGLYLYASDWHRYQRSMQHGVGRIDSKNICNTDIPVKKKGIATALITNGVVPKQVEYVYNSKDLFLDQFCFEQKTIGYCVPELVIHTKK